MRNIPTTAILAGIAAALAVAGGARANVEISSAATSNMSCAGGVCAPTGQNAVLNVGDLQNLLASGNVKVTTTGSGVQADNIKIVARLNWSSTNTLAIDANETILIEKPVSVKGPGGLFITTNDGGKSGYFGFSAKGNVTFADLSSALTINGVPYTLVSSIQLLATAVAANPSGAYALAQSYDANQDGAYSNAPIPTLFMGNFNGLGNSIYNLTIDDTNVADSVGFFGEIGADGSVSDIGIANAKIAGTGNLIGGMAGKSEGNVENVFVTGSLTDSPSNSEAGTGGLVGWNFGGTIIECHTNVSIKVSGENEGGGLAGSSSGSVFDSYATGSVAVGDSEDGGGLIAYNSGTVEQSYSMAKVTGGEGAIIGGFISINSGATVAQTYSTGAVKDSADKHGGGYKGGFVGEDGAPAGSMRSAYWNTSTSDVKNSKRGAGTPKNDPGIEGLTTVQLQSGLPNGFDKKVWAEDPKINDGFPYLINNPPR